MKHFKAMVKFYTVNIVKNRYHQASAFKRWGTWLEAALYYGEHFEKIKNIISNLNTETATAIDKANNLMENNNLKNNLIYNSANFGFLIHTIKQLETRNMPLSESLCIVEESKKKLEKC